MKQFLDEDFLLKTDVAKALFHNYAKELPIIDYHCHVSPKEICENKQYSNITELWLGGDHYKWRQMRSFGIDEKYITGDASDYEKFKAYAKVMPYLIGNPLYHWTHLELQRYFDCDLQLSEETCDEIWRITQEKLSSPEMRTKNIIMASKVETLCTTDDPIDTLEYHIKLKEDKSFTTRVLPAFRPDKCLNINRPDICDYISKLSAVSGIEVKDIYTLKQALQQRIAFFDSLGCRTSDHALDGLDFYVQPNEFLANEVFVNALNNNGKGIEQDKLILFKVEMLKFFASEYKKYGWVMQYHCGTVRNANSTMFKKLGPDTGFDTIGHMSTETITKVFDLLESNNALPKTILYSLNPMDNAAIGTILGAFQNSGDGMPQVMQGSAWWFNDTLDGMKAQMKQLANLSVFGKFLGMLTDSRSFTSYPRHEYFRRILCDIIGDWVEEGLYPYNPDMLAQLVMDICYNNTKEFFKF